METNTQIDFVEEKTNNKSKFKAKCFHCKEKDTLTTDNGMPFELPYASVEIKKDKDLLKECKEYAKESQEKYKNARIIKKAILNGCPKCGRTINICCKDYADFYTQKKKENKKEEKINK